MPSYSVDPDKLEVARTFPGPRTIVAQVLHASGERPDFLPRDMARAEACARKQYASLHVVRTVVPKNDPRRNTASVEYPNPIVTAIYVVKPVPGFESAFIRPPLPEARRE